jgi:hypothetical protein
VSDAEIFDGVLEALIDQARLEYASAPRVVDRMMAAQALKWLVKHRTPERVVAMERERGLRGA